MALAAKRQRRSKATDEADTSEIKVVEIGAVTKPSRWEGIGARFSTFAASTVPVWIGVLLVAAGFATVGYTWARVAGLLNVALQLPYFASGGLTALGLILVGLTIINISAKHRDATEQNRQLEELRELLSELRK